MAPSRPNPLFADVRDAVGVMWEDFGYGLAKRVFATVTDNFERALSNRPESNPQKNWSWVGQRVTPTTRPEEKLERELVSARGNRDDWCNQLPVASGLVPHLNRCSIDLVHRRTPRAYDFVELKLGSDSPMYAAVEVLQYGCLWVLSRSAQANGRLKYPSATLLEADDIALCVLAPESFYGKDRFQDFCSGIERALKEIAPTGVKMTFRFEHFPSRVWEQRATPGKPEVLRKLLDGRIRRK